jgi:pilus assembly protein CpaD
MTSTKSSRKKRLILLSPTTARITLAAAIAVAITACRPGEEPGAHVAGWTLIDASQRHPIVVSQQPANLTVRVPRGSSGLTPSQRSSIIDFMNRYRGGGGSDRLTIAVPTGAPNEVAALHAVADMRQLIREYGVDDSRVTVKPYHTDGEPQPPIRVSYARFVAEAPQCGQWPTNLSDDSRNLPYPNFACAQQRNIAAQIANPADLLGPRTMTPASGERTNQQWEKWTKGEATIAKKDQDERVQVKGQ